MNIPTPDTLKHPSFSKHQPGLRLVWDATSLTAFMRDPLSYYWSYVLGYRTEPGISIVWGKTWHESRAVLLGEFAAGRSKGQALEVAINHAIKLADKWDLQRLAAEDTRKRETHNLYTILRALVWYADQFLTPLDPYKLYRFKDGRPALEVSFAYLLPHPLSPDRPLRARTGEEYVLAGNLDAIFQSKDSGDAFVVESKSTVKTLGPYFYRDYDPSVQLNTYAAVRDLMLPGHEVGGVIIEAVQTAKTLSRFERHPVYRTRKQNEQWLRTLAYWIGQAENMAVLHDWENAFNPASSSWWNDYREIANSTPESWYPKLRTVAERREPWNPLHRGDD